MKMDRQVTILIPKHVSVHIPKPASADDSFYILVWKSGVLWRTLAPILLKAPSMIAERLLMLILQSSQKKRKIKSSLTKSRKQTRVETNNDVSGDCPYPGFFYRQVSANAIPKSFTLYVQPPSIDPSPDATFLSVVLRTENSMLKLQTLSAWLSTLGGGYFFCKRLGVSLQLARQQRALAVKLGNTSMIRQCTVNEAYNLIYAGKFQEAKQILTILEATLQGDDDVVTKRQCQAARVFAKRLKQVSKRGVLERYHPTDKQENHTIDDYQRIRIVEE
jgi:hypothetical protein